MIDDVMLEVSGGQLAALVGTLGVATLLVDLHRGSIVAVSPEASDLLGQPARLLIGRGVAEVLPGLETAGTTGASGSAGTGRRTVRVALPGGEVQCLATVLELGRAPVSVQLIGLGCAAGPEQAEHQAALFTSVVEFAWDAVMSCDADGLITTWNPAAERMYGYHASEIIGRTVTVLYAPEVAARDGTVFARVLRGEPTEDLRTVRCRRDGSRVQVRTSFGPIREAGGNLTGVASITHDLTGQVRTEAWFAALLDATPDAILAVTADGRIVFANTSCERLLGYGREELIGSHARALFAEDVREQMIALRRRLFTDADTRATTSGVTSQMETKGGHNFPAEITISWLPQPAGPIMICAARDLSELRRAEARFQALLEAAPDSISALDRDGRIVLVNAATERMLGYPREQLVGNEAVTMIGEADRDRVAQELGHAFDSPDGPVVIVADAVRADGSTVPTENTVTRFNDLGREILLVLSRDISARVTAEAERQRLVEQVDRQRADQMLQREQRLEALGELAGGVAHDFNNLLAIIVNYAALLAEDLSALAGADPQRWQPLLSDLTRIQQAAQRGATLTGQLLAFGRRDLAQPRTLALNAVLTDLQPSLSTAIGERVELRTRLSDDLWPVRMDPSQPERILVNLAENARDAMPSGGELLIETGNVPPGEGGPADPARSDDRYVRLRVTDTGCGMPLAVAERAFEPFFTTKPKGQGSGLGLASAYGIVTQMGGDISIKSQPDVGTTVTILLPATDRDLEPPERPTGTRRSRSQGVILLVDDQEDVRESTARVLTRQGYRVVTAVNGSEALDRIRRPAERIALLLTDVVMPGMDGWTLAQRARVLAPDLPMVFMSGYADPVLDTNRLSTEDITLLKKPFTPDALLHVLNATLRAD